MAAVSITDIKVLDNPAPFTSPFKFEIMYESVDSLAEDTQWKLIYVGSADDKSNDQLLDDFFVGPINVGTFRFHLEANALDPSKIPEKDIIGMTVILLTCSYVGQEFVRVGFFVKNEYDDAKMRKEPPKRVLIERIQRTILTDNPKVTKYPINFHPENAQSGEQAAPEANEEQQEEERNEET